MTTSAPVGSSHPMSKPYEPVSNLFHAGCGGGYVPNHSMRRA